MIKLLREEHLPARKIGREWRFSKEALLRWISEGDSMNYINRSDLFTASVDEAGETPQLLESISEKLKLLSSDTGLRRLLPLEREVSLPENATLRVCYKQHRDVEKFEFKIYWPMRDEARGIGGCEAAEAPKN